MSKRMKTKYPGVYYRDSQRVGGPGKEKVYYIVFKKDGKMIEEKVGRQYIDDLSPAKAARIRSERIEGKRLSRKEIKEQEEAKKAAEAGKYTIEKLWQEYKLNRPSGKSLKIDQGRYEKYIEPVFGRKEPQEIIKLDVDRVRIKLLKKLSPQTVKHILNLFTWIINYGTKNNLCHGISFHIQKPSVNNEKTEDLTPAELERLLKAIEEDENIEVGNMMKMALYTGMRRGEMFKLQWRNVNLDTGFILLKDPKGGPDQKIPINDIAKDLLNSIVRTKSPYVFPGRHGGMRTTLGVAGRRIRKNAGLPDDFRPMHGLRHVYASMLASSGKVDMYVLQKLMTHKSPKMTQRYAHLRDEALKDGAGQIDDIFKQASEKDKIIKIK
ncbi:tyrosine-type recombinase/integrase [Desulfobacula toluolica]|uniref:Integrase n=1 Tax=Desulfobacula toluolica (strain DSM 7467 / Tol2) TaxID=651182 RepID=K0NCV5_DESTT|nr:site-specific integrase [Desulfobacula toluolica]CCK82404.1 integrase [Desulfobacula toluolica Tol2]